MVVSSPIPLKQILGFTETTAAFEMSHPSRAGGIRSVYLAKRASAFRHELLAVECRKVAEPRFRLVRGLGECPENGVRLKDMRRIATGDSVCTIATGMSLSSPRETNRCSRHANRSSSNVNVGPTNTSGASMKSKPWDFRFALRLPSSHSNCIYEVYIHG